MKQLALNRSAAVCAGILAFGAVLSLAAGGSGAERLSLRAQAVLHNAGRRIDQQQYEAAVSILQPFIDRHEKVPAAAYVLLGNALYLQGSPARAREAFCTGLQAYRGSYSLCHNCAVTSYEAGAYDEAAQLFEEACRIVRASSGTPPENSTAGKGDCGRMLYQAAASWYQAGRFRETRRVLEGLVEDKKQPEPDWLTLLVHTYIELKRSDRAQETLARLLRIMPDMPQYWKLLAQLRCEKSQYREAAAALAVAVSLDPQPDRGDLQALADLYLSLGAPLQAAHVLNRIDNCSAAGSLYGLISRSYERAHRYEEALSFLEKARSRMPPGQYCLTQAQILYRRGSHEDALHVLSGCEADNATGQVGILTGRIAWDLSRWGTARSALEKAAAIPAARDQVLAGLEVLDSLDAARTDPPSGISAAARRQGTTDQ